MSMRDLQVLHRLRPVPGLVPRRLRRRVEGRGGRDGHVRLSDVSADGLRGLGGEPDCDRGTALGRAAAARTQFAGERRGRERRGGRGEGEGNGGEREGRGRGEGRGGEGNGGDGGGERGKGGERRGARVL